MSSLLLALLLLLPVPQGQGFGAVFGRRVLAHTRVAMAVIDAESGQLLFGRETDRPMIPASNMKLLTTAAAVRELGADYVFVTTLSAAALPDAEGHLESDLVLRGSGDPCLRTDLLAGTGIADPVGFLADLLVSSGVRRIDGRLLLDDSLFDRQWVHPEWERDDLVNAYAAPVGALSLERNCLSILVDGRAAGSQPSALLRTDSSVYALRNDVSWSSVRGRNTVGATRPDEHGLVRVTGHVGHGVAGSPFELPVRDPGLFFGRTLMARLAERGLSVAGGLERVASASAQHAGALELVRYETPIDRALVVANKESDNSICDHLFKLLGARAEGQGSFAAGGRAIERFLRERIGIETQGLSFRDGSGLAASNRVSARALAATLAAMTHAPDAERDLYLRSLPVSGLDGTLDKRLMDPPYRGAVRAKTGYIHGVSSLSGLAWTRSGRVLAFSILMNGFSAPVRNRDMKQAQDDLCRELVDRW